MKLHDLFEDEARDELRIYDPALQQKIASLAAEYGARADSSHPLSLIIAQIEDTEDKNERTILELSRQVDALEKRIAELEYEDESLQYNSTDDDRATI